MTDFIFADEVARSGGAAQIEHELLACLVSTVANLKPFDGALSNEKLTGDAFGQLVDRRVVGRDRPRQIVALAKEAHAVVREPDLAIGVFPDEQLQGKVQSGARSYLCDSNRAIRGPQPPSPLALKLIDRFNRMAADNARFKALEQQAGPLGLDLAAFQIVPRDVVFLPEAFKVAVR